MRTFRKLGHHDIRRWTLTGGMAVEFHLLRCGCQPTTRALNDIDFIADSFAAIPESLAHDFLFRHIHPSDPPGKTMLQFIDAESRLRIDVLRAYGAMLSRSSNLNLPIGTISIVSLEDLTARMARLALDLAAEVPVPPKHVADFLRLTELADPEQVESVWPDHRKQGHPTTFEEANRFLKNLIPRCSHLLTSTDYSQDADVVCTRCSNTDAFQLADSKTILSLLGYC